MSKSFWTLLRGAVHAAEQDAIDRSALLILDQHIRDAAAGIERAKRALAVAIAQDEAEGRRLDFDIRPDRRPRGKDHRGARGGPRGTRDRSGRSHRHDGSGPGRHPGSPLAVRQGDRPPAARRRRRQPSPQRARTWPPHCACRGSGAKAALRRRAARPRRHRSRRGRGHAAAAARTPGRGCRGRLSPADARCRHAPATRSPTGSRPKASAAAPGRPPPRCWSVCASASLNRPS